MSLLYAQKVLVRFLIGLLLLPVAAFCETISMVSGDGQVIPLTYAVPNPLVVVVIDSSGKPASNDTVFWSVNPKTTGGILTSLTTTTQADGTSSNGFIAPIKLQPQQSFLQTTVTARAGNSSVKFTITIVGKDSSGLGLAFLQAVLLSPPNVQTLLEGASGQPGAVPIKVFVVATGGTQGGSPVPQVLVKVAPTQSNAGSTVACAGGNPYTDATGVATCNLLYGGLTGTGQLTVDVGVLGVFTLFYKVDAGQQGLIKIVSGDKQSIRPGQASPLALVAQVTDIAGNPLSGVSVVFEPVVAGSVTLSDTHTPSDASGNVSVRVTPGNAAGPIQVRVRTTDGKISALFTINVNNAVGGILASAGDQQTAVVGTAFTDPLVVQVNDTNGNPLIGTQVAFTVTEGSATVGTKSAGFVVEATDAQGHASTTVTAGNTAGAIIVSAIVVAGASVDFNLTARQPFPSCTPGSTFYNGAGFQPNYIAPGALATIYCAGLTKGIQGAVMPGLFGGPLPYQIAGVSVTFGSTNIQAPIYDVVNLNGTESVTVEVPVDASLVGTEIPVTITAPVGAITVNATVLPLAPGIFETGDAGPDGRRMAVVLRPDGSPVSPTNPILRGETGRAFVTGLTPPGGLATDALAPIDSDIVIPTPVIVGINNAGVRVPSVKYARGMVGVWEVEFVVPKGTNPDARAPFAVAVPVNGKLIFAQPSTINVQ
jgi:uncharacterized protein (TIGR03437 family)